MAALGEPDLVSKLKTGYEADGRTFKVHLDGYNQLSLLKWDAPGSRKEIHYISDDGDYCAFRYDKWKISFLTQESLEEDVWDGEYTAHRFPRICNLREDPYEDAQNNMEPVFTGKIGNLDVPFY